MDAQRGHTSVCTLIRRLAVIQLGLITGLVAGSLHAQLASNPDEADPRSRAYLFKVRASQLDSSAREYPEIDFVFHKDGQPQDLQHAAVDTRVAARSLVIWLMGYNRPLFERLNGYGIHAIQVHYANKWFGLLCQPHPSSLVARGNVRLEAATGEDVSDEVVIHKPDSMMERARQLLIWLTGQHADGGWEQFLSQDQSEIRWDKVTIAGSSHGATTAARFAQHQLVDRVVMLCGPRDQDQDWQSGPSATPSHHYFGFSHVLDAGWSGNHYCRSWEMLGLHEWGPIVRVEQSQPPYENSRRLVSAADVGNDVQRAHSAVTPGLASPKLADGSFLYEPVWDYLFNHPVDRVGQPSPLDPACVVPPRNATR